MTTRTVQEIKVSEVRELLKAGVTRFRADDEGFGSIEERYNLSPAAVRRLFQNEYLKGLKTIVPEFILVVDVDDTPIEDIEETPDEVHEAEVLARGSFAVPESEGETLSRFFPKLGSESPDSPKDVVDPKEDLVEDLFK